MSYNQKKCLTDVQMDKISNIFSNSLDLAHAKVFDNDKVEVEEFLWNLFLRYKIKELFTQKALINMSSGLFSITVICDFIQDLTSQFGITSVGVYHNENGSIEKTIAIGLVGDGSPDEENFAPFTPKVILDNSENNPEVIYHLLLSNKWLTTIVLIIMYLHKTDIVKSDGNDKLKNKYSRSSQEIV